MMFKIHLPHGKCEQLTSNGRNHDTLLFIFFVIFTMTLFRGR